jgi:hypothetical protein
LFSLISLNVLSASSRATGRFPINWIASFFEFPDEKAACKDGGGVGVSDFVPFVVIVAGMGAGESSIFSCDVSAKVGD